MSELFQNAVLSIRLGVEDYKRGEPERALSAIRNFYAGVLLLAKEVLIRAAPDAEAGAIIGARYKPVPDGAGGVKYEQDGVQTIDFSSIERRFKDFGLTLEKRPLDELARIRNDVEHHFSQQTEASIREAIAKTFPVAAELFRLAEEEPRKALGEAWDVMIETKDLYDRELARCRANLAKIDWISSTVGGASKTCCDCGSGLVEQKDPENADQQAAEFRCLGCGDDLDTGKFISAILAEALAGEAYVRVKDGGEDGPVFTCGECGEDAYVDFEEKCACCGYELELQDCDGCGAQLSIEELMDGEELCSYCRHKVEKIRYE